MKDLPINTINDMDEEIFNTPFIYNFNNSLNYTNVLLIDSTVQDYNLFINYSNSNTLPIVFSYSSNTNELLELLTLKFATINRLAIVTHDSGINNYKQFLNNQLLFTEDDLKENNVNYSDNLLFIINLIQKFNISNFDYLACNTLNYEHWNKYYSILSSNTSVIVGASNDLTGNVKYGGDWVMESTKEDVELIYFTTGIENYSKTLATTIIRSVTITQAAIQAGVYTFPVTINGGTRLSPTVVTLGSDLILTSFFIIGSQYVTFDGAGRSVTINNTPSYPGLIQNGIVGAKGYSNVMVKNVTVKSSGTTTLADYGGYVCQRYFGSGLNNSQASRTINVTVTNCHSTALINGFRSGGIIGHEAGFNYGNVKCNDCSSTGIISGNATGYNSGGIFGRRAGSTYGTIECNNCHSTGEISGGGGIFGSSAGYNNGSVVCSGCYSTGDINNIISGPDNYGAGGIFGVSAGFVFGNVQCIGCYSIGNINDGGIFASQAGDEGGVVSCKQCYSTGDINRGGGIFGFRTGQYSGNVQCIGCYSTGNINGGGIFAQQAGQEGGVVSCKQCYSTGDIIKGGGIFSLYIGINDSDSSAPASTILIQDCYSLGNNLINSISGGICGGYTLDKINIVKPIVTITNCYSYCKFVNNNGIISSSALPQINYVPSYLYPTNGTWNSTQANKNLLIPTSIWNNVSNTTTIPYFLNNVFLSPTYSKYTISEESYTIPLNNNYIYYTVVPPTDGTLVYTDNFLIYKNNGRDDTFTYEVNDGINYFNLITYVITFGICKEIMPFIKNVCYKTSKNQEIKIKLKVEGFNLDFFITKPKHGTLYCDKEDYIYKPDKNYVGEDSFNYKYNVRNTCLYSDSVSVKIKIIPNCN